MRNDCRMYVWGLILCLIGYGTVSHAQNILADLDHDAHHVYDRMLILSGGDSAVHSGLRPFWRHDIVRLADSFAIQANQKHEAHQLLSIWDQHNEFVPHDPVVTMIRMGSPGHNADPYWIARHRNSQRPLWNTFFKTPAHFYEVDVPDFYLRVNPALQVAAGRESHEGVTTFVNQRGLSLRGGIGKGVYFQTSLYDSQVRFPNYVNQLTDSLGVVPGAGLYKNYNSTLFGSAQSRDYLLGYGYVGINFGKYVGMQLGHNQTFIGDGIRSLFLSDFSAPYFSLRFNTRIWKFHYQNIFAEVAADNFMSVNGFSEAIPKKYMAAHYLSFKPSNAITIGLFETVIFDRPGNRFELQYLNPIILFRTIEGSIGSPDNVILGASVRADLKKRLSVYGQFVLDDIQISNVLKGDLDWWGNKFGHQLGIKYINIFGLSSLDGQIEWNSVRPYTYSHYNSNSNYSNYKQPLAHPLGANFNEWILTLRYQASPRLLLKSRLLLISTGEDLDSISFGGSVIAPNTNRPADYGHFIGQGVGADIMAWSSSAHFVLRRGVYIDGLLLMRQKKSDIPARNLNTTLFQLGVRYNITMRDDAF